MFIKDILDAFKFVQLIQENKVKAWWQWKNVAYIINQGKVTEKTISQVSIHWIVAIHDEEEDFGFVEWVQVIHGVD